MALMWIGLVILCWPGVEAADLTGVPAEYYDLHQVFCRSGATSLPPHRPYDCAIDLLAGTSPPKGHLFSLSGPEREAMDKYIHDSLNACLIRPSSSSAVLLSTSTVGRFLPPDPVSPQQPPQLATPLLSHLPCLAPAVSPLRELCALFAL
ncbi:hypothetical protein F2P79_020481 [Pimephales promelas]|nr:hypothetical protein F2P79_020481 [Pimephales promelas]